MVHSSLCAVNLPLPSAASEEKESTEDLELQAHKLDMMPNII